MLHSAKRPCSNYNLTDGGVTSIKHFQDLIYQNVFIIIYETNIRKMFIKCSQLNSFQVIDALMFCFVLVAILVCEV